MKLLTTQQAADQLGVTDARVRAMIRDGRLRAERFGRAHMIREDELKLVADRKPGRPPKPKPEEQESKARKSGKRKVR